MTRFYIPSKGPESWKEFLAEPDKHWKTGYSARSLAYCWEEAQGFPQSVVDVFQSSPFELFHSIEFILGVPEHKVDLPPKGGRPSQNDIFVLGKSGNQLVSITVEGKVNETLGPTVAEKRKDMSPGVKERLEFLVDLLQLKDKALDPIRYQLLHRTASALIEADRFSASSALMLVHSFSQEHKWFEDYAAFAGLYGIEAELNKVHYVGRFNGKELYIAWVTGEAVYLTR